MKPLQLLLIAFGLGLAGAIFLLIKLSTYNSDSTPSENINSLIGEIKDSGKEEFEEPLTTRASPNTLPEKLLAPKNTFPLKEKNSDHYQRFDTENSENLQENDTNDFFENSSD